MVMNGKATVAEFFSGALQTMAKEGLCAVDVNMKWGEKDVQFQLRVLTVDGQPIETLAEACTPLDFDSATTKIEGGYVECLMCGGDGEVQLEADYLNFDGVAIGVQFYGIGNHHGAAERYLRALPPATVLELCRLARIGQRVEREVEVPLPDDDPAGDTYTGAWRIGYNQRLTELKEATK